MRIILTIIITLGLSVVLIAINEICKRPSNSNNIPIYEEITPEEEIIMLLKNIAKNQRTIKVNTTIIAIILLVPILIGIFIWATGASIISTLFN